MGNVKPWQIVLMVVAVVAVAASAYFSFSGSSGRPELISEITMVDVTTGQLFNFTLGGKRGVSVPETNPDSGKRTLVPVYKDSAGTWMVDPRDRPALREFSKEPKLFVDGNSGKVEAAPGKPRHVR